MLPTIFESLVAGSMSGMAAILVCHPFDVLRTNIQLHSTQPVSSIMKSTFIGGFSTLYKGITGPFFAQGLYKSIIFASNTFSQSYLFSSNNYLTSIFMGGMLAGAINSLVVSPVEIIRTRQIFSNTSQGSNQYLSVVRDIYKRNGISGFWIGIIPTIIRDAPGMGFYMISFDLVKKFLLHVHRNSSDNSNGLEVPLWVRLVAGSAAGIAYWTWALPVDTFKTLIESSNMKKFSPISAWHQFVSSFHHLYRALPVAYARGIPSAAVTLTVYELVIEEMLRKRSIYS